MRILFITNLLPYPLDNGGKIKTFNTLKMLTKANTIDLFSFYESDKECESIEYMNSIVNSVNVVKKPLTTAKNMKNMIPIAAKSLFSKKPFVLLKFIDKDMSRMLSEVINRNKYDLIYIDHLQLAVYIDILKKAQCPIYLDEHNCEYQILNRKAQVQKGIIKSNFVKLECKKLKHFEENIIDKVDKVIVLSEEDRRMLDTTMENDKFNIIPIPLEVDYKKEIQEKIKRKIDIMFLGTLSWYPNAQGIEWFIDKVIPQLNKENIEYNMYIVGKDPSEELVNKCSKYTNITITGYVDDVNEYFEKCDVMVVPLFVGSGMRVKILEGLGKRIPIISTKIGAEGIEVVDGESILIADNEQEFVSSIMKLGEIELYKNIQHNGEKVFESLYSISAIENKYNDVIR